MTAALPAQVFQKYSVQVTRGVLAPGPGSAVDGLAGHRLVLNVIEIAWPRVYVGNLAPALAVIKWSCPAAHMCTSRPQPQLFPKKSYWITRLRNPLSVTGLLVGTLFLAASLTPSLIPRPYVVQGVLSGVSLAIGYGIGVLAKWLWYYLELPVPGRRAGLNIKLVAAGVCLATAFAFLWQAPEWQNSIRMRMDLEPVDGGHPLKVGMIAVLVFVGLYLLAKPFHLTNVLFSGWLRRHVPRRVSNVVGVAAAVALFWSLIDGVLLQYGLRAVDRSFQEFDAVVEEDVAAPKDPMRAGSPESLVAWVNMGRAGRRFVSAGPTPAQIASFLPDDEKARQPIRVFVGLNSRDTAEARAELALEELKRVNAFDRSILLILTPTGSGVIDPGAINTIEYLHRGDVASVAVQYSYLPSALSLLIEPGYGAETASALFDKVYEHWTNLPAWDRPRLYLHGLSLGAMNSELSADMFDVVGDPFQGALWSGPPFASSTWETATENRNWGSPAWLPRFRDGSIIRFTNQQKHLDDPDSPWGPIRIAYLQYASDPIAFFEPSSLYREPEWMKYPRGPDVSRQLRWYPIVTFLQLIVDMMIATTPPIGYGHAYAPEDYIDAWIAITEPTGWSEDEIKELKSRFQWRWAGPFMPWADVGR